MTAPLARRGGEILVRHLMLNGVSRVFMVAGESFLPCIDALYGHRDAIATVSFRQEGAAAYAAEAHGKLTGEPGVCFVTRGPGATNAAIGLHTAYQDGTPMILFVGQIGSDTTERDCFQEIDYRRMFAPVAKWVASIDRTDRIPEFVARAFRVARSGRPGPVVLALPEDTLWGEAAVADVPPAPRPHPHPAPAELARLGEILEGAGRPFMIVGGAGWTEEALAGLRAFAERYDLPVGVAWRRLECFDNRHPNFAGHVGYGMDGRLARRIEEADLLLAVCTRLDEPTTEGYVHVRSPVPRQRLVHVHPDPDELGRVYRADLPIVADPVGFAAAVAGLAPRAAPRWAGAARAANAEYLATLEPGPMPGAMNLSALSACLRERLPKDACVTVGAGNFALFPHRFLQFSGLGTQASPICGAMGYGLPAAIAAKLAFPGRMVVAYAGDGCFQMTMQELGTAAQNRLGIVVLVFNNGMWGTIRQHQEREFPGRVFGLSLTNPDFAALVRAYGGHGETVARTEDFLPAFERAAAFAEAERMPALIEVRYDPDGITPDTTLDAVRRAALARAGTA
ncbi:thiamine pyrophosphate-binding protein [Chelatococcus sp. SYSU_G07232]|uniref:Thiamine pyrophosphate-binding protein n=1 Tax=Chelatococcus albus TaxID=3047466 RepID=A0ABT7AJA3_9HYPH|nr:thiamine pyrophosphate-binding protein [Chelatococcus sp. SYSU_G07232]MDJ1159190.1 thiamine pyrophosphate-binding protein [Chelatococcus sp. SYSU_G07232]